MHLGFCFRLSLRGWLPEVCSFPHFPSAQLLKEPRLELMYCCNGAGMKARGPAAWSCSLTHTCTHTHTHTHTHVLKDSPTPAPLMDITLRPSRLVSNFIKASF